MSKIYTAYDANWIEDFSVEVVVRDNGDPALLKAAEHAAKRSDDEWDSQDEHSYIICGRRVDVQVIFTPVYVSKFSEMTEKQKQAWEEFCNNNPSAKTKPIPLACLDDDGDQP